MHVHNLGYAFCAGPCFKSVLHVHVVLCVRYGGVFMYHGVGEERLLRKEKGWGEGACLRADHGMASAVLECSASR